MQALIGPKDVEHAVSGPMVGAIFETAVIGEVLKAFMHRGIKPQLYFWRTSAPAEVDLIVDAGGRLVPIEVKSSATPSPAIGASIRTFRNDWGEKTSPGFVIHPGDVRLPLGAEVTALPFSAL